MTSKNKQGRHRRGRRRYLAIVAACCAVAAALVPLLLRKPATPQYVFMITLDAARQDHFSCYGYGTKTSPNIDKIAARSAVFDNAISQASWTTASVASIVSSQFPCEHGLRWSSGSSTPFEGLETNFIKMMSAQGFQTASFMAGVDLKKKVPTSDLTGKAVRWLRKNRDKKCVVWIYSYETHYPYVASPSCAGRLDPGYSGPYGTRFENMEVLEDARLGRFDLTGLTTADVRHLEALYDCQITQADRAVGAFVDSLSALGIEDRSIFFIFSDHGEEFLDHGTIEHGQQLYEETIRVPLIVYAPSFSKKAKRISDQVGLIDLAPTILDVVGIQSPASFEGRSFASDISPRFQAPPATARPCGIPASCLISESIAHRPEMKVLRCPPWKLFFDPFFGAVELYNLNDDPRETQNVIAQEPDVTRSMTDNLLKTERYYPGGWYVAWRSGPSSIEGTGGSITAGSITAGSITGSMEIAEAPLEAVTHNFGPGLAGEAADSIVLKGAGAQGIGGQTGQGAGGRGAGARGASYRLRCGAAPGWKGVELRMAGEASARLALRLAGAPVQVAIGKSKVATCPIEMAPSEARVDRRDLGSLFANPAANVVIFWCDPGSEPVARVKQNENLRKELKAIGYIQ